MSTILPNDKELLQELLNKIMLYRITRNLNNELQTRNIKHYKISEATGRSGNWFNRTFNDLEDMRLTTFIKLVASVPKVVTENNTKEPVPVTSIMTEEVMEIASLLLDLNDIEISDLLDPDAGKREFFKELKPYVDLLENANKASKEETEAYNRALQLID
jgi:hypothetical protein